MIIPIFNKRINRDIEILMIKIKKITLLYIQQISQIYGQKHKVFLTCDERYIWDIYMNIYTHRHMFEIWICMFRIESKMIWKICLNEISHSNFGWLELVILGLPYIHTYIHIYIYIYMDFGARSRYLRQRWVIASHSILWDAIIYPCLRYLLLAPKSSYYSYCIYYLWMSTKP